jgi:hypothetical protein
MELGGTGAFEVAVTAEVAEKKIPGDNRASAARYGSSESNLFDWFRSVIPMGNRLQDAVHPCRRHCGFTGVLPGRDKEVEAGYSDRLLHCVCVSSREGVHGEMESEKRSSEILPTINTSDSVELSGGGGERDCSGAGCHGGDSDSGRRCGIDADHGVGGTSEITEFVCKGTCSDPRSSTEEVQESFEGFVGSFYSGGNAERFEENDEQCQSQEEGIGMKCINNSVDGSTALPSPSQQFSKLGSIGGKFGVLCDEEEDSDSTIEVQSLPALSPGNEVKITDVIDEGGWSVPVSRKKKLIQSRRSKKKMPLVVDGCWRRPTRRWIDLGSAVKDHRPPKAHCLKDAFVVARQTQGQKQRRWGCVDKSKERDGERRMESLLN